MEEIVRRPNPTKGTRPPPQQTERDSERGEGVIVVRRGFIVTIQVPLFFGIILILLD